MTLRAPAASVDEPTKPLAAPIGGSNGLATAPPAGAAFPLTPSRFAELFPRCQDQAETVSALAKYAPAYGITTATVLAMLLAQVGHESGGFTRWTENLHYSSERLLAIFPRHFTPASAADYATRGPISIANKVYANRLGNGNEASGDGYLYRGRGPIQLTGRSNYARYGAIVGLDLVAQPALAASVKVGVEIACAYFQAAGCIQPSELHDLAGVTRRVNGGLNGLIDRARRWEHAKRVLQVAA